MRRRLYFLLPDIESARAIADDLLLARIEDRHMRFLARRGTDLRELHEAGYLVKTDLVHGAGIGLGLGALGGVALGAMIVLAPIPGTHPHPATVFLGLLLGALFGAWVASMVGASVPNVHLRQFQQALDAGRILMMVDVRIDGIEPITRMVLARHPEAEPHGVVRPYPVFP